MQLEPGRLRMLPYFTSISTVRVLGDRRVVGAIGDTAHLEVDSAPSPPSAGLPRRRGRATSL